MDARRQDLEGFPPTLAGLPEWIAGRHPKPLSVGRVSNGQVSGLGGRELRDHVRDIALGLGALGLKRGDRLAIISESRPEWVHVDLAAQTLGVVDVPVYPTLPPSQTEYILRDSSARFAVVSSADQLAKVREVAPRLPLLTTVIVMDAGWQAEPGERLTTLSLAQVAEQGGARIREGWGVVKEYNDASKLVQPHDLATIIYTSGTTGEPKGVMLTHNNLVTNLIAAADLLQVDHTDTALSFLPLSHSFERLASYLYLGVGVTIVFAENMETVARDLQIVKPTVITGVPRVYEKLYARVLEKGAAATGIKKKLFQWAVRLAEERGRTLPAAGKPPHVFEGLRAKLADKLVLSKVREAVGGRVRFMVSGSAALPKHIGEFFYGCGLTVMEGYGLTETSPVLTVTPHTAVRFGAVGKAITGVDLRIAEDGEILARGPNIMQGYYNKPAETAEVLKDGWFHTGDIGSIDADGYLHITDRKKDLIVTAGGKKIAPQPLESRLKSHPVVAEAIVIGEGRKFPAALFVPDAAALAAALGEPAGTDAAELLKRPEAQALFQAALDDVNRDLGQFEKLKKFDFLPRPLTQADNELTPTLKVRRKVIEQKYSDVIERMYTAPATR
ncbi:MAG TPA: long-chain fatty acid--CoA ligase [Vicinamibacterales bacterium]